MLTRAQIDEVSHGDEVLGDPGPPIAVLEQDQPLRVGIRQRPQQHGVDHGEDRDVGADAERQREDGGEGEARLPDEEPQRVAEIMKEHRKDLGWRQAPAL